MRLRVLPVRLLALVAVAILVSTALPPAAAEDKGDLGKSVKKVGEGMKKLGRKIGNAGKEAGEEIAEASKKVWFKGKKVSARLLKRTQSATRSWWEEVLEGKDRTLRDLRRENKRLKRELADEPD